MVRVQLYSPHLPETDFWSAGLMGKDRLGWIFQGQLAYTVQDFVALVDGGKASEYEPRAVNNTVWGLYNIITYVNHFHIAGSC